MNNRKRFLIASALFEYILNDEGKPFELQSQNNVEEMKDILNSDYPEFVELLETQKAMTHANMRKRITKVTE